MTLTEQVERFAKALALFSPGDEEAAMGLRRAYEQNCEFVSSSQALALQEIHARIDALLGEVETDVANEQTLEELGRLATGLQRAASQLDGGLDERALETLVSEGDTAATSADVIDRELLSLFLASCETTLSDLEGEVLGSEKATDPAECIAGVRRTIHTFKGECGVLSLSVAQELCHRMETGVDLAMESQHRLPVDLILDLVDWLRAYVDLLQLDHNAAPPDSSALSQALDCYLASGQEPGQDIAVVAARTTNAGGCTVDDGEFVTFEIEEDYLENLPEFLTEAQSHLIDAEAAVLEFDKDGREDFELIDRTFRSFHTIKGVAGFLNLTPIVELAHTAETLLDGLRKRSFRCTTRMVDVILQSCDAMGRLVDLLQGQASMSQAEHRRLIRALEEITANPGTETDPHGSLSAKTEEVFTETPAQPMPAVADGPGSLPSPEDAKAARRRKDLTKKLSSTITVSTTRLDSLVDLVGELVIAQSMVTQDPTMQDIEAEQLSRNLSQVNKITRDLQEGAMSLRMVTLKATFQKMARLVRDVSAKAKKQVELQISGEETELDRNVVEEISDPLIHLIRNALDHGIEPPDERVARGKPRTGVLQLKAYHQGGSIVIEIRDDGRGLSEEKILKKAIERGLLPPDKKLEGLSESEVHGLVFHPGFSTADELTDISGRGVGLDVVKGNIEALRGKVEIYSKQGEGTTFKMILPLTLAIIDGMIIRVGSQRYVIPTLAIVQSFQPGAGLTTRIFGKGETVRVRGQMLPIRKLRTIFGLNEGETDPSKGLLVVVEENSNRSCLLVDEILGQQQVVIKNLGKATGNIRGVSGGAILGDGRIALILDISSLLEEAAAERTDVVGAEQ